MKITFLGSSHGIPEPNRKCSCTMIETQNRVYFIDMGVMAINELTDRGIPIESVKGVFITHMHGDHTNGLFSFCDLISWYYRSVEAPIFLPKPEAARIITDWIALGCHQSRALDFRAVNEGLIFDDGFIKISASKTLHNERSFSYLVEAEGKRIVFSGDLADPSKDFPKFALDSKTELCVLEGAHFPADRYFEFIEKSGIKQLCINHYAPWNIPNIQKLFAQLKQIKTVFATDGLIIEI
ncbi:MAG: ribonuclease Z [Clostridia bacterium]|nr:ribonuclease Z [Clostridia bacterium]